MIIIYSCKVLILALHGFFVFSLSDRAKVFVSYPRTTFVETRGAKAQSHHITKKFTRIIKTSMDVTKGFTCVTRKVYVCNQKGKFGHVLDVDLQKIKVIYF